ncbi:MAG: aminoacyl-tRNA hydrolase [Candidatus Saccharimonadales bacterium]
MGLFQKKPAVESSAPFYTIDEQKPLLIVGLGNIGEKYADSRHNIGFKAVDRFASKFDFSKWSEKHALRSLIAESTLENNKIILIKPMTYMNNSGEAMQAVQNYFKISNEHTLVVHDDVDIDFGQIRLRMGGAAAGHNGIKSIISHCGEGFGRARVGIGPKKPTTIPSEDFVLKNFSKKEVAELSALLQETTAILSEYCFSSGQLNAETRSFIF